jgi:antitoxin FitA
VTKVVQVRGVPDDVHAELCCRAAAAGLSLSDLALQELSRLARRPSVADLMARAATRASEPLTFVEARDAILAGRPNGFA